MKRFHQLSRAKLRTLFHEQVLPIYHDYPRRSLLEDGFDRLHFYIDLLSKEGMIQPGVRAVDLCSGLSYLAVLLKHLGLRVAIVDDFEGGGGVEKEFKVVCEAILKRFEDVGIEVYRREVLSQKLPFDDESVDVFTCSHALEHFHHSPRQLFGEIKRCLKENGILLLATPNSVNLRKRMWVLFGKSNLCPLEEWYYEGEPFRGHVHEPTVGEVKKLMVWNELTIRSVMGRNFIGRDSLVLRNSPKTRRSWQLLLLGIDPFLRLWPTLCSDIHVIGKKTTAGHRVS